MSQRVTPIHWLCLALSIAFQVTAVVLGKTAASRMATPTIDAFLTSPWYLAGLGCLVLQALCWQIVVRAIQLFVAYMVSTSLNYLLILAASSVFFRERVSVWNLAGAALRSCWDMPVGPGGSSMIAAVAIFLLGVVAASSGHVLIKKGAVLGRDRSILVSLLNPFVMAGYALMLVSTVTSTIALQVLPLHLTVSLMPLGYVVVVILSVAVLGERMRRHHMWGMLTVFVGIVVFNLGAM